MRALLTSVVIALVTLATASALAQQRGAQGAARDAISLAELLANGFEIRGAVLAGILVQNGTLAYICTTQQRERPVEWACFSLNR